VRSAGARADSAAGAAAGAATGVRTEAATGAAAESGAGMGARPLSRRSHTASGVVARLRREPGVLPFRTLLALGTVGALSLGPAGCGPAERGQGAEIDGIVAEFLPLERRAMHLREARFALADSIRFATADLLATPDGAARSGLEARLRGMEARRDLLVDESLAVADTIRAALAVILEEKLPGREDQRAFHGRLQAELAASVPD
jgi:hypothetical protein